MKKLMIAALGLAAVGSVFGAPQVFDYKASVKHMYLKRVNARIDGTTYQVYQKYAKSASLKGYLIMDDDGVTSKSISGSAATVTDHGRNRGFLVVQNSKAESKVRAPKILPAVLDSKWIDTSFRRNHAATTGLAEGMLFVGGEIGTSVRTKLDMLNGVLTARQAPESGIVAYGDYFWSSIYLFGEFNGPNWFTSSGVSVFDQFEQAWEGAKDLTPDTNAMGPTRSQNNYFHDTWMNGAGIGKYRTATEGEVCCGIQSRNSRVLNNLSGNLKGGLFLCTDNGIDSEDRQYMWADGATAEDCWEDQFNCQREVPGAVFADKWYNDLWNDGSIEVETTDVLYGTWSIKWNRTFMNSVALSLDKDVSGENAVLTAIAAHPAANAGVGELWHAIKGAVRKLNRNVTLYSGDNIVDQTSGNRFVLPVVDKNFAEAYGLTL